MRASIIIVLVCCIAAAVASSSRDDFTEFDPESFLVETYDDLMTISAYIPDTTSYTLML
jgi:hypothetical protein